MNASTREASELTLVTANAELQNAEANLVHAKTLVMLRRRAAEAVRLEAAKHGVTLP